MKIFYIIIALTSFTYAQQYEAPRQLMAQLASHINTQTCLKACSDPLCVPAIAITCCSHHACDVPWPIACSLGTVIASSFLGYATECDETKFNYYSVKTLATFKKGFLAMFPCMEPAKSVTKKTE